MEHRNRQKRTTRQDKKSYIVAHGKNNKTCMMMEDYCQISDNINEGRTKIKEIFSFNMGRGEDLKL